MSKKFHVHKVYPNCCGRVIQFKPTLIWFEVKGILGRIHVDKPLAQRKPVEYKESNKRVQVLTN